MRTIDGDALDDFLASAEIEATNKQRYVLAGALNTIREKLRNFPSAQPEITDEQAIEHLQETGWMQNHDKQMYEMGLREQLADDSDSYDALLPSAQSEQAVKDCRNCKYGKYNDHWKTHFCYNPNECTEWNLWEPSEQQERLTDKEQRIFLAAMGREEKVCEEVDRNHVREPYEDSLMRVCKEIRRKVKGALWT